MKILLIGGTNGFGAAIAAELTRIGHEIITIGRSGGDYRVDVGDAEQCKNIFGNIATEQGVLDGVICIVGFARALPTEAQTNEAVAEHMQKNVGYVEQALAALSLSENAFVVTTGSQWSWKDGGDIIRPYADAKHALVEVTQQYSAEHPKQSVLHLCVPPMNTPQREEVWREYGKQPESTESISVAEANHIAHVFVNKALEGGHRGEIIQIDTDGGCTEIQKEVDPIEYKRRLR